MGTTAPPLPDGVSIGPSTQVANRLHSHAIHLLRRARAADSASGLTPERLSLLSVLAYAGARTVGELATAEMVSAPAISRTLAALEALGLVRRVRSGLDRRKVRAHATEAGRKLMERGRHARVERIAMDLHNLDQEDLVLLSKAMDILDDVQQSRAAISTRL